jgi:heme/copper-type cytochrome/quinol oxidase subunit 3
MAQTSTSSPVRGAAVRRSLRLVRLTGTATPGRRVSVRDSPALLGMKVFLASEAVLFAALIAAYLALRTQAAGWPPPGQPRLPVAVTGLNTLVLVCSGGTVWLALHMARAGRFGACRRWLTTTLALGLTFLFVQGSEWVRLIGFGLRMSSSTYGGMFYSLIGVHALHVVAAVGVLAAVLWRDRRRRFIRTRLVDVAVGHLYWVFVVAVWPLLYGLVYLW